MTPRYVPEHLFLTLPVLIEADCSFCTEKIEQKDEFYVAVTIPHKHVMSTHIDCFEQLSWSMANYVFTGKYKKPKGES